MSSSNSIKPIRWSWIISICRLLGRFPVMAGNISATLSDTANRGVHFGGASAQAAAERTRAKSAVIFIFYVRDYFFGLPFLRLAFPFGWLESVFLASSVNSSVCPCQTFSNSFTFSGIFAARLFCSARSVFKS